ncbi:hypothetical protein [Amycolatopsis keratiniphila]|uniref:hypothetical protein n=1 Tax=Amycolatopsis keratiniphila TaxID=129921 RepID=UPI00039E68B9|nr:hypothetical protein [Amycolatopsis keratiniphila]
MIVITGARTATPDELIVPMSGAPTCTVAVPPFGSARVVSSVTQTAMNAYWLR